MTRVTGFRWPGRAGRRLVRSSPGPVHALLHRDVGAVQLLRDAGAARALHDRRGGERRSGTDRRHRHRHLRALHLSGSMPWRCRVDGSRIGLTGQRQAVLWGGIVIAAGHLTLAIPTVTAFYVGLVLIVIGTGLLKPNVSAIVADLYPEGGARRDAGFSVFYMGINVGALAGPIVCGLSRGEHQLASGIQRRRDRDEPGRRAVRLGMASISVTPARCGSRPAQPGEGLAVVPLRCGRDDRDPRRPRSACGPSGG